LEARTPTPQRRMEVLKTLTDLWVWTVIRLRPYIIGITDKTVKDIVEAGWKAKVKALSTEALCLDTRMNELTRAKFKELSKLCWFDIVKFYKQHSNTVWYLRLSREYLRPYMEELVHLCADNNIKLAVSCPKHKEKTFWYSCCWLPTEW
jgi:DNA repair photolyase